MRISHRSDSGRAAEREPTPLARWCERFAVAIVFVVFVVFRAADRVFLKRVTNAMQNPIYTLILTNVFWPISIQVMTILMLLCYMVMLRRQGHKEYNWRFFLPGNPLASSMGAVPLAQLALFSLGDQLNAALQAPASPFISQPMQSIMTQMVIVWMLVLAIVWLRTRFSQVHVIGCTLIVLSVLVGLSNLIQANDCTPVGLSTNKCLTSYKDAQGQFVKLSGTSTILWFGLFVVSTWPSAISNVYKQRVLKGRDVDVCYATWWSGNFQVLWGLLCFWVNWIPLPGQPAPPLPSQTFTTIADSWVCFTGGIPHKGDESCASGSLPPIFWFGIYLIFNLTFNICFLWLTKRMSAMWAQIATTLCLDLTNFFSQFRFLMGKGAQVMSLSDWLATILASVALWAYNLETEGTQDDAQDPKSEAHDRPVPTTGSMTSDGRAALVTQLSSFSERMGHTERLL